MDRRSWLWRRKSLEKSPGESESSGSVSSHSERYSDDQEVLRASPNNSSPYNAQSPEASSNISGSELHETVRNLTEKLSAALLRISSKEDLVKQHMKVAEEAVLGWEKAETELSTLKEQLEAAAQKNSALEDRIGHLNEALKESLGQLQLSREEQQQRVHDGVTKKIREWESDKFELENRLIEVQVQLEAAKAEATTSVDHDIRSKLEVSEKENMALKVELLTRSEDLQMRTLEKELSTRAAETASKQHLESIKKVAKLEAECHRLRSLARRTSSANDHKPITNSVCVESLTDSHSDSGERSFGLHNKPSRSDSWASALISELDQFKSEKASARNLATSSMEIDLMDDFLEMEKLVETPEADHGSSIFELEAESNCVLTRDSPLEVELEAARRRMSELEEKVDKMETEKVELQMALDDTRNRLELSRNQLIVYVDKLVLLQRHLDSADESKLVAMTEVVTMEEKAKTLQSRLESAVTKVGKLREEVCVLDDKVEEEEAVSAEFAAKVEAVEATRKALECRLESAHSEVGKLREMVVLLEDEVEEERSVSAEFASNMETVEAARKAMEAELQSAHVEVAELRHRAKFLEEKVEEEKALSAQLAVKCQNLDCDMAMKRREAELQRVTISNGEFKIKQEEELAIAAGKLAECQKTIASLGQQLKSLTSLDDFTLEDERTELNGGSPDLRRWGCKGIAH